MVKVAVTFSLELSVTVQVEAVPLHVPPQPTKDEFAAAVAVSVTTVPRLKLAVQFGRQLIPPVLLVTVPDPVTITVNIGALWVALKVAVTV
jgi:hypothetical protein